jgi:TolB-like protein/tetratricopeptide (TPR) repeat protein
MSLFAVPAPVPREGLVPPVTDELHWLQRSLGERYHLVQELGRGGMATVYLADDRKQGRRVALKAMHPAIAQSHGAERFLREIEIAGRLQHPHILGLYDSGSYGVAPEPVGLYYAMPYVEGESLRSRLARESQLPIDEAVRIAREVADALGYAHDRGLVHRDIKPENILLSDGHAVVADFGIAKALTASDSRRLTETGLAMGTPAYMSPEQVDGTASLDGRSDLYALGCVLYEMLAGQPPFGGATAQAVMVRHAVDPVPSLGTVRRTVPAGLEAVIVRAMAKVPADRFATAADFADALAHPDAFAPRRRSYRKLVGSAAGAAVLLTLLAIVIPPTRRVAAAGASEVKSLAVLPIENLTGDSSQVFLADGMTDQLITDLAKIGELRVIGRTSMMRYKGTGKTPPEIARELHVDAVLVGSLQRAGDAIHLSAQLTAASTGEALWAEGYDGVMRDVLQLQRGVARSIADRIRVGMSPVARRQFVLRARPVDPAAYNKYIAGRYWWNKRGAANLKRAVGFFQEALDLDPTDASAYSGRADAYVQLGYGGFLAPDDAFPKAKAAALTALQLDSTLAEPHASLGYFYLYYDWNWSKADQEFQRALSLNPSYATAREWYSLYLAAVGRLAEAEVQVKRAVDLEPLSVPIASTAGWITHYAGKQAEAEAMLRRALAMDSTFGIAHLYLGRVYQAQGKNREAIAEYQATGPLRTWVPTLAGMGNVAATMGDRREARRILVKLDSLARSEFVTAYGVALVYAALGEKDRAFTWLDKAVDQRTHWLVWLNRDPRWDPLRADPRFRALVRRVGLPQ